MATPSPPVHANVVPDSQARKEIEEAIDAFPKLEEAIAELKKQRKDAKGELAQLVARDLAAAPQSIDTAIARDKAWKAKDEALEAKISAAGQLQRKIEARINELKTAQPDAFREVIQARLAQLARETAEDKSKMDVRKKQIAKLKAAEAQVTKPPRTAKPTPTKRSKK
jgi:DNA repair exonuclease SbcCD ATPase subunit